MLRILFLGTGDFAVPALRALHQRGHPVTAVISQPDRPAGRGREVRPTPAHAAAAELGLRHVQAEDVNSLAPADIMTSTGSGVGLADVGVVAAFGQKIGPRLLAALPRGCVNIHGSLLPRYRGAAPFQRAILDGEETTGVTIFQLDERWDTGMIWSQRSTPIDDAETADELHDRLAALGAELIGPTLDDIETGRITPRPQDPAQASRAPKLSKADGTVDWSGPARLVVRRIHGLWSWPGAACRFESRSGSQERVLLIRAAVADTSSSPTEAGPPGSFLADGTVQAGRGRIRLLEVQPAGRKRMAFEAFANGRRVGPGDRLATLVP